MTFRAIVIGLLAGAAIAAGGYYNDWVIQVSLFARNLAMPGILGLLILALLIANPLLRLIRSAPLRGGEWAVIVSLAMIAAVIPGPAVLWQFNDALVWPHHYRQAEPGWRKLDLVAYAPPQMLMDPAGEPESVVQFIRGIHPPDLPEIEDVPWSAWSVTWAFWGPLVALVMLGSVCLAAVVHPQWSRNESLRYPVADFTSQIIGDSSRGLPGGLLRSRLFWTGAAISGTILLINGLETYFPDTVTVPLTLDLTPALQKWPDIRKIDRWYWLLQPRLYFVGLAFAYFLAADVSLSVGISHILYAIVLWFLLIVGVDNTWYPLEGNYASHLSYGAYLGMAVALLYTGRRHYVSVLRAAVTGGGDAPRLSVWGCRGVLLTGGGTFAWLVLAAGLSWAVAAVLVLSIGLLFVVMTRIHTETGVIIIQPGWWVAGPVLGWFGYESIGPHATIAVALIAVAVAMDPRTTMMPVAANALRLGEDRGVRPTRLTRWALLAVIVSIVIAVPATLYVQYAFGQEGQFLWGEAVGKYPFQLLQRKLALHGGPPPGDPQGLRPDLIDVNGTFLTCTLIGAGLVGVLAFLRLRFTWWPLHPVVILLWASDTTRPLMPSFLLGWACRTVIVHFAGGKGHQKYKPVFIGLFAGEILAGIIWAIVGVSYYWMHGYPPPRLSPWPF